MFDPKVFEEIAKKLSDALPSGLQDAKKDLQKTFHSILQNAFSKLDLVSREEFDTQVAVLAKTREKLEALEKIVATLEKTSTISKPSAPDKKPD